MAEPSRKLPLDLNSLARAHTINVIDTLAGIARAGENDAVKVAACAQLLDRGWGRPKQDTTNSHEIKGELQITLRKLLSGEPEESSDER